MRNSLGQLPGGGWEAVETVSATELERARRSAARMAASIARRLPAWIDGEVLSVEAEAAVWRAALRYCPDRGASFATWSGTVVHRSLLEEIRRQSPWTRNQRRLRRESLEAGTEPEGWMLPPVSLSTVPSEDWESRFADGGTLEEAVPATTPTEAEPEWSVERVWIAELLTRLDPRRREVVRRYFWAGQSCREIAEALGVSTSRVQQLRKQAQEQLREAIEGAPLDTRQRRRRARPSPSALGAVAP
jgi:RNA polymerase sigma factor (sigma-70 family)